MEPAPAPPFEVTETPTGRLYRLPQRQLGGLRFLAIAPLALAIALGGLLAEAYLVRAARGPLNDWAWVTFILTGLGWTRASYSLASLAVAIWCGRTEIEVADDGRLWATDRNGWFRVRWGKLQPGAARKLVVAELMKVTNSTDKAGTLPTVVWNLTVETDRGRKVWLAPGHSREVLAALADELANRLALAPIPQNHPDTGEALPVPALAPLPVVVEEPEVPNRDVLEQPATSRIVLERHPDGVTVTVPARGIWQTSGGLVVLGGVFTLVGGGLAISLIAQLFQANPRGFFNGEFVGVIFLLVGVGILLSCYHFGRKRCVLAVVGDRLLTFETGPLGSRRRSFTRAELLDVACGPSNVSVNNKPLPQLQILIVGGKQPVGMMTGYEEAELQWLATVLRQSLGIPSEAPQYRKPARDPAKPWK